MSPRSSRSSRPTAPARLMPELRVEVGRLRRRETRRVFDTVVHVGVPGGDRETFVARTKDLPVLDAGLRTDVVARLLDQATEAAQWLWLTRAGQPTLHDLDLAWLGSGRVAFAAHGRELAGCYAVTRTGWLDIATGENRTWKRLRL